MRDTWSHLRMWVLYVPIRLGQSKAQKVVVILGYLAVRSCILLHTPAYSCLSYHLPRRASPASTSCTSCINSSGQPVVLRWSGMKLAGTSRRASPCPRPRPSEHLHSSSFGNKFKKADLPTFLKLDTRLVVDCFGSQVKTKRRDISS